MDNEIVKYLEFDVIIFDKDILETLNNWIYYKYYELWIICADVLINYLDKIINYYDICYEYKNILIEYINIQYDDAYYITEDYIKILNEQILYIHDNCEYLEEWNIVDNNYVDEKVTICIVM